MKKLLLLALLTTTPVFAQQPPHQIAFNIHQLDTCAGLSINYAMLIDKAHLAPSEDEYNKFVNGMIANQPSYVTDAMKISIRKFASEAWEERNLPPTEAGMDLFHQCEQAMIKAAIQGGQQQ